MAVNRAFHTNNITAIATEQNLYRDLIAEVIQIYGHDVHYIDRTIVAEDNILGEDTLSKFSSSAKIEMYAENAEGGYSGELELMNKFGLQNLSDITFVVAKHRFQELTKQITIESGTDTTGGAILLESGTIEMSSNAVVFEGEDFYVLNETDATDSDRPLEGDLIYHPILEKLFIVNFVDHDASFNQLDNNPAYRLQCRTFDYSSEMLDTGISEIDAIEDALSNASSEYQISLENATIVGQSLTVDRTSYTLDITNVTVDAATISTDDDPASFGGSILLETGSDEYIITEEYYIGDYVNDKTAQNELFDKLDDAVLDFSESNPFGDVGSLN